jgi:hypothetical protein
MGADTQSRARATGWLVVAMTCAVLTILSAGLLVLTQKRLEQLQHRPAVVAQKTDDALFNQLEAAKKELASAQLRLKAEKATSASIRNKLIEAKKALKMATAPQKTNHTPQSPKPMPKTRAPQSKPVVKPEPVMEKAAENQGAIKPATDQGPPLDTTDPAPPLSAPSIPTETNLPHTGGSVTDPHREEVPAEDHTGEKARAKTGTPQ